MKQHLAILILSFAFLQISAQNTPPSVETNLFKINILTPGITYEKGLNTTITLCSDLNIAVGLSNNSDSGSSLLLTPYIREQFRYYYNLNSRRKKGKKTQNNSGNFIAFSGSYYLKPINNSEYVSVYDGFTIAPSWGLQRSYKSRFNLSLITGLGYNFGTKDSEAGIVPVINFSLGWRIGK